MGIGNARHHGEGRGDLGTQARPELSQASALVSDHLRSAPRLARAAAAFRLRIRRRRCRRRHRHQAQLGRRSTAIEMVPRYGVMPELPPVGVELFGRKYTAPIGVAPDGQPDRGVAGRRQAVRGGGAARRRALHARLRRRRHHRGDRRDRARRVLVPALSLRQEQPRHRLRTGQARRSRRRARADADARRAGAHHPRARGQGRSRRRRRLQGRLAHGRRHGQVPRLGDGDGQATACRALPTSSPMPARTPASTTPSASRARRWAARSPGRRSRATASSGRARWW